MRPSSATMVLLFTVAWALTGRQLEAEEEKVAWSSKKNVSLAGGENISEAFGFRVVSSVDLYSRFRKKVGFGFCSTQTVQNNVSQSFAILYGACYIPGSKNHGINCYLAAYHSSEQEGAWWEMTSDMEDWKNKDVSTASIYVPISFLSLSELRNDGNELHKWGMDQFEWSATHQSIHGDGGDLETEYFTGKLPEKSWGLTLSATVASNVGVLNTANAYVSPLGLELIFRVNNFTYSSGGGLNYLTLATAVGGPQYGVDFPVVQRVQNTNTIQYSGEIFGSYVASCDYCSMGFANEVVRVHEVIVPGTFDRAPSLAEQMADIYFSYTNMTHIMSSFSEGFEQPMFDMTIGVGEDPLVVQFQYKHFSDMIVAAVVGFLVTASLCVLVAITIAYQGEGRSRGRVRIIKPEPSAEGEYGRTYGSASSSQTSSQSSLRSG